MNKNKKRILCILQGTQSDIYEGKPDINNTPISKLRSLGIIDEIVLGLPDIDGIDVYRAIAKDWGVTFFKGNAFNVVDRFNQIIDQEKPDVVLRIQIRAFWIDEQLVLRQINEVLKGYDYVELSRDVNYAMGADVFHFEVFKKLEKIINEYEDRYVKESLFFSPWSLLKKENGFNTVALEYKEIWPKDRVNLLKNKLDLLLKDEENMSFSASNDPSNKYLFYKKFINKNDEVLDIASGHGAGTLIISEYCKQIVGIDYNKQYIDYANKQLEKNKKITNVKFIFGTDQTLIKDNYLFDSIISSHTLEHIKDDILFLESLYKLLKPKGRLVLEVPRLIRYPLEEPLWPFHEKEYEAVTLKFLLEKTGFKILHSYGGDRRKYVGIENAREVILFICEKSIEDDF